MLQKVLYGAVLCILFLLALAAADTPANCTYEEIVGTWVFQFGEGNKNKDVNCSQPFSPVNKIKINLVYPNVATDEFNNNGVWTLIYNQGFEVVIAGRKYFAFSHFEGNVSFCDRVTGGWSHDVLGNDWACYDGRKSTSAMKINAVPVKGHSLRFKHPINSREIVRVINNAQSSWKAATYPQFEDLSDEDFLKLAGGKKSIIYSRPKSAPLTDAHRRLMGNLPESFDWRNVNGVNFVSPVRDQGGCGSCYAFGSLGMDEARIRILTNNTQKPVFSPQDVVECSPYSQGCEGGFPYLIGGKYAEDYGLVLEDCNPYKGIDGKCQTNPACVRHYFTNYQYVGGYYGATNEAVMLQALYEEGPLAVGFFVYDDFFNYKSGIYHHVPSIDGGIGRFNPFDITNHAVLLVGWGVDPKTLEKYWIVKNSWGEGWGLSGYFWIRRGNDECGFESLAVKSTPVFTFNA
uniref:Dipeptidyl peptidase 1 n=1 Tax=Arion vulgaris TaxID=1028688 RepID=A0A0B6ZA32_9EUPU